jgi:hypothetical protein
VRLAPVTHAALVGLASLALSVGLILLLSGYFAARDQAGVSGTAGAPGQSLRDLSDARLGPGQAGLDDQQLRQALALGDVVIAYGGHRRPAGLQTLARQVAGPFSSALARAGQAVILARRPGVSGLIGLAWAHIIRVRGPGDPALRALAQYWLGRGAAGASPSH